MKRAFYMEKDCMDNEEIIVKENFNNLILEDFYIYNNGDDVLEIRINNSDEIIRINNDENYTFSYPVYSCLVIKANSVRYGGVY
jgi:hypothetical protein